MSERTQWAAPLAAIAAAFGMIACCLPLGFLAALGAAGAGIFLSRYRMLFLALAPVFLVVGFWQHYRARSCNIRAHRIGAVLLWLATFVVLAVFLFPQWIAWLLVGGGQ